MYIKNFLTNSKIIISVLIILIIICGNWIYNDFIDYKPSKPIYCEVINVKALPKTNEYPTYAFTYIDQYGNQIEVEKFINDSSSLNIVRLSTNNNNYLKIEPTGKKILFLTHETLQKERY